VEPKKTDPAKKIDSPPKATKPKNTALGRKQEINESPRSGQADYTAP
jgi:hypothetical protein